LLPDLGGVGKTKGVMGMTWQWRVQRGVFALGIVAALAVASGADWFDILWGFFW
jgi:hypothetical protein